MHVMLITDTRDDDDEEGEDEEEGEEKAGGTQSKSIFSSLDPVSLVIFQVLFVSVNSICLS